MTKYCGKVITAKDYSQVIDVLVKAHTVEQFGFDNVGVIRDFMIISSTEDFLGLSKIILGEGIQVTDIFHF